jgi:hypothetical protein
MTVIILDDIYPLYFFTQAEFPLLSSASSTRDLTCIAGKPQKITCPSYDKIKQQGGKSFACT